MKLTTYVLLLVLAGGTLTYNYQTAREKAKEEELARQNRLEECLKRYPTVSAWF